MKREYLARKRKLLFQIKKGNLKTNWCERGGGSNTLVSTHERSIFVKIIFNFKKKNISMDKSKPENSLNIAKN